MTSIVHERPSPPALSPDDALFLDVDGVLLRFAPTPDGVVVSPALVDRLRALEHLLGGALALVSGRGIQALDRLFAPLHLPCAGLHGLERRHGSSVERVQVAPREALERIKVIAEALAGKYDGALVEDKGVALALHWRADPLAASDFQALAAAAVMTLPDYHLQHGNHVVELRPAGADKGTAIAAFLEEAPFAGRRAVFIGDDLTDEHGFDVVNQRGGTSILVGMRAPSAASHGLADVADVHAWLGVDSATSEKGTACKTA